MDAVICLTGIKCASHVIWLRRHKVVDFFCDILAMTINDH